MRAESPRGTKALSPEKVQKELDRLYAGERCRLAVIAREEGAPPGDYAAPVFGTGPLNPRVLFLGEAPGREEARRGCGFVGQAGKLFDVLLASAGVCREEAFITNTVRFRPLDPRTGKANRPPKPQEIKEALPLLEQEIALVRPRFIVTLGNTPLSAVLALAGLPRERVGVARGKRLSVCVGGCGAVLLPTLHPASAFRNSTNKPAMEEDFRALGEFLKEAEQ